MTARRSIDIAQATDVLMITFDALRYDVAERAHREGRTKTLAELLPQGWEPRHTPGNFTFAAHAALFGGFWPTRTGPEPSPRPFALRFPGSRTLDATTLVLDGSNIVEGLRRLGYYTLCIGGVGFFNKLTPLGSVFPAMFDESHWLPEFAVSQVHSTRAQVRTTVECLSQQLTSRPVFVFINISATHPPTMGYLQGAVQDSVDTQDAALGYADRQLRPLWECLRGRGRGLQAFLMSDHGTLFGEEGLTGHRIGHPTVWTVPYGEFRWERSP
jgi:hypothetical protein